jgi:hypothetical protein
MIFLPAVLVHFPSFPGRIIQRWPTRVNPTYIPCEFELQAGFGSRWMDLMEVIGHKPSPFLMHMETGNSRIFNAFPDLLHK